MQVTAYTTVQVFEALADDWNSLLVRSVNNLIFLTLEWQSTWWGAYQPGALWVLAIRDDNETLVGIAPWFIQTQPDGQRTIRSIGCVDVTDYLDVIVHTDYAPKVYAALASYLKAHADQFDTLDLCNVPEYSPLLTAFATALRDCGMSVEIVDQDVCPVVQLPDDFAEYVQNLDKKNRHELRRKMRKMDGLGEDASWYVVGDEHHLDEEVDHFLQLMAAASAEKEAFLRDPQHVAFFKSMVPIMYANGWLEMAFLQIRGEYAAAYLNFVYNNHVLVYNSGLNVDVGGGLSPGIVLIGYLIRSAIAAGRSHYDFLRGDETYKYHLGGQDTQVLNLMARVINDPEAM